MIFLNYYCHSREACNLESSTPPENPLGNILQHALQLVLGAVFARARKIIVSRLRADFLLKSSSFCLKCRRMGLYSAEKRYTNVA